MGKKDNWRRIAEALETIGEVLGQPAKYHADRWLRSRTDAQLSTMSNSMSFGARGLGPKKDDKTQRRKRARALMLLAHVRGRGADALKYKGWRTGKTLDVLNRELQTYWGRFTPPAHEDPSPHRPVANDRDFETRLAAEGLDLLAHITMFPPSEGELRPTQSANDFTSLAMTLGGLQEATFPLFMTTKMRDIKPKNRAHGNSLPICWLPWNSCHIIHVTLPSGRGTPRFFFTAAIGGCSVFVQGPANGPTVYHAGVTGPLSAPEPTSVLKAWPNTRENLELRRLAKDEQSEPFWERLMAKNHQATLAAPLWGKVDRRDYVRDGSMFKGTKCTLRVLSLIERMEGIYESEGLSVSDVRPSGCVFGIQDDNSEWSFYLQENVAIKYQLKKVQNKPKLEATFPFELHKIWPVPAQRVSMVPKFCRMGWLLEAGESVAAVR